MKKGPEGQDSAGEERANVLSELLEKRNKTNRELSPYELQKSISTELQKAFEAKQGGSMIQKFQTAPAARRGEILDGFRESTRASLERLGLGIEVYDAGFAISLSQDPNTPIELRGSVIMYSLKDSQKLMDYLRALQEQEQLSSEEQQSLMKLAENFMRLIKYQYEQLETDMDAMIELISNLEDIIALLKEISGANERMKGVVEQLETYLSTSRQRCMQEWIEVEKEGLMSGTEHFGPSAWHRDMMEGYPEQWQKAVTLLELLAKNEHAQERYQALKNHLLSSIKQARADIPTVDYLNGGEEYLKVLDESQEKIEAL